MAQALYNKGEARVLTQEDRIARSERIAEVAIPTDPLVRYEALVRQYESRVKDGDIKDILFDPDVSGNMVFLGDLKKELRSMELKHHQVDRHQIKINDLIDRVDKLLPYKGGHGF